MKCYRLVLKTLNPLHIGDGVELRRDFDYVVRAGRTWRLNLDAVLEAKWEALAERGGDPPPPGKLLNKEDFEDPGLFRYVLKGAPRSEKPFAEVRSQVKDPFDRPYIPGSSLKGVLRTALAWAGWEEQRLRLDPSLLRRKAKWPAQEIEKGLFGKDPNHSLMRALKVSDLHGPQSPGEGLVLINAQVLNREDLASPIETEALHGGLEFQGELLLDTALLEGPWAKRLGFDDRARWLHELEARVRAHSQARLEAQVVWFESVPIAKKVAAFYRDLLELTRQGKALPIQLGWGGGWDSKTLGSRLKEDARAFEKMVDKYNLNRVGRRAGGRASLKTFPNSRRVVVLTDDEGRNPQIAAPLGWCLLTLQPEDG